MSRVSQENNLNY